MQIATKLSTRNFKFQDSHAFFNQISENILKDFGSVIFWTSQKFRIFLLNFLLDLDQKIECFLTF